MLGTDSGSLCIYESNGTLVRPELPDTGSELDVPDIADFMRVLATIIEDNMASLSGTGKSDPESTPQCEASSGQLLVHTLCDGMTCNGLDHFFGLGILENNNECDREC